MKRITDEIALSEEQLNEARALSRAVGVSERMAQILYSRGICTQAQAERFLNPSRKNFLSPFLMHGMRELVDAIAACKAHGGRIAIFGDYDADGIGAASILMLALRRFGAECTAHIPERSDGYGMSVEALDSIIGEYAPELIVTVDCGISNREEVEYIKSRGVKVIVTDHHEIPDVLPDCVIVNPKLDDDYPYDKMCGAGVAFKVACALLGEKAYEYLDIAAISTVADSVPLTGENRDIVSEGLRRINSRPRAAVRCLLGAKKEDVNAQTLAFTIAPRINAAGRMGDASSALKLFTSDKISEIDGLACRLNEYNLERQQVCDDVYRSAKEKIAWGGAYDNAIVLADEEWSAGLIGIVAAKIAEEFNRPTILFARSGGALKGSARTIDGINIYEAIKACSAHVTAFGGHAQAAGVSVTEAQFPALKAALNEYIGRMYGAESFVPAVSVCGRDVPVDLTFAKELERLEPCGVGNRRPLFSQTLASVEARRLKDGSPHIAFRGGPLEMVWFGGERALPVLGADVEKTVIFEADVSRFRGTETARGIVRDMICGGNVGEKTSLYLFCNNLLRLRCAAPQVQTVRCTAEEIGSRIRAARAQSNYGLALLCSEGVPAEFSECTEGLAASLFRPDSQNIGNTVLLSPSADAELSMYRDVIFLDTPADFNIKSLEGKKIVVNCEKCGYNTIAELETSREYMGEIYRAVRGGLAGTDSVTAVQNAALAFPQRQAVFALEVFAELGLVRFERGGMTASRGKKTDLRESALYRAVCALKEET